MDDSDCESLKRIISSIRFFIGACTHSAINAYSSNVLNLLTVYSVKTQGIAKDTIGKTDGYVIPVKSMETADELKTALIEILKNKTEIKNILHQSFPNTSIMQNQQLSFSKKEYEKRSLPFGRDLLL